MKCLQYRSEEELAELKGSIFLVLSLLLSLDSSFEFV